MTKIKSNLDGTYTFMNRVITTKPFTTRAYYYLNNDEVQILYAPKTLDQKLQSVIGKRVSINETEPIEVPHGLLRQFIVKIIT